MAEEKTPPPPPEDVEPLDVPGWKLETLGDVRRAMAATIRRVERGNIDYRRGQVLITGLGVLANIMQDHRDSVHKRRLAELWKEHEQKRAAPQQGTPAVQ